MKRHTFRVLKKKFQSEWHWRDRKIYSEYDPEGTSKLGMGQTKGIIYERTEKCS